MFFFFSSGFMSTLNRKISIRISAAINLFLDYFTMLWGPACPAAATPAQPWYLRGCAKYFVSGARHCPMEPPEAQSVQRRCQAADQLLEEIVTLPFCLFNPLPILGLDDFTLAWFSGSAVSCSKPPHAQKAPVLLTERVKTALGLCKTAAAHI